MQFKLIQFIESYFRKPQILRMDDDCSALVIAVAHAAGSRDPYLVDPALRSGPLLQRPENFHAMDVRTASQIPLALVRADEDLHAGFDWERIHA